MDCIIFLTGVGWNNLQIIIVEMQNIVDIKISMNYTAIKKLILMWRYV